MGRRGVLSSSEEEASLSWLDQTGEQSSVHPRSLSPRAVGADIGQTGIVRGTRTGVAGGGPAGTKGRGLRSAPTRWEAGAGGGGPAGPSALAGTEVPHWCSKGRPSRNEGAGPMVSSNQARGGSRRRGTSRRQRSACRGQRRRAVESMCWRRDPPAAGRAGQKKVGGPTLGQGQRRDGMATRRGRGPVGATVQIDE